MRDMIEWLQYLLSDQNTKLIYGWVMLGGLMVIDFLVGAVMAIINPNIQFSSFKMKVGIMVKLVEIVLAILAVPFIVAFGGDFGMGGLWLVYGGLCFAELWSIFGHMKVVDDGKGIHLLEAMYKQIFNKGDNTK